MSNFNYVNDITRINAQAPQPLDVSNIYNLSRAVSSGYKTGLDIAQTMRENALWKDTADIKRLENDKRREYLNAAETPEQIGSYFGFKQPITVQNVSMPSSNNQSGGQSRTPQRLTSIERERMYLKDAGLNDREIATMLYPDGSKLLNEMRLYNSMVPHNGSYTAYDNGNASMGFDQSSGTGVITSGMEAFSGGTGGTTPAMPMNVTPVKMPYDLSQNTTSEAEKNLLSVAFDNRLTPDQRQARLLSIGQSSNNNASYTWPYSVV